MANNKEFCYSLSISDFREETYESFHGVFMNEESLIQAYQELETLDPRVSKGKNSSMCDIYIYKIPCNCLFYSTDSLQTDKYDFYDYIFNNFS